jgi:superfamily II DNA or RNA helicase
MNYTNLRNQLYSQLRSYQREAIDEILSTFQKGEITSIVRQNFTGTGKSVEQNFLAINWLAESEDNVYLFLIHREELLDNAANYFDTNKVPYSFIRRGFKTLYSNRAFLAGVDFLNAKRLEVLKERLGDRKLLIVIDETHHSAAKTWTNILNTFPNALKVGFTATLVRLDGNGFDHLFQHLIQGKQYEWYIENNFLSPFQIHLPKTIEMELKKGGDSLQEQAEAMTDNILGDAVTKWHEFTPGLKTITFCPTIPVSEKIARMYNEFGKEHYGKDEICRHLDGTSDKKYRRETLERFRLPADHPDSLLIISNVELLIEGVNVPDCCVTQHLRFTKSEVFYDQMNGRSNRPVPGKMQHILDHVGNVKEHGAPNRNRSYELVGKAQQEKDKFRLICSTCNFELSSDYRQLLEAEPNNVWISCPRCNSQTLIPSIPLTKKKKEKQIKDVQFEDVDFVTLASHDYNLINQMATFNKYKKIASHKEFFNALARLPYCTYDMLLAACTFRGVPPTYAMSAFSKMLELQK